MIRMNEQCEREGLRRIAELMCVAARTAPYASGRDNIVTAIIEDEDERRALAERMMLIGEQAGAPFFTRDAKLVMAAPVVVIGHAPGPAAHSGLQFLRLRGLRGGRLRRARCAYNARTWGSPWLGRTCAADHRADNRICHHRTRRWSWSYGRAGEDRARYSTECAGKSIFFDRK